MAQLADIQTEYSREDRREMTRPQASPSGVWFEALFTDRSSIFGSLAQTVQFLILPRTDPPNGDASQLQNQNEVCSCLTQLRPATQDSGEASVKGSTTKFQVNH